MKRNDLYQRLDDLDRRGRRIFTMDDLGKVLDHSNPRVMESYLYREVRKPVPLLTRVAHGIYMNNFTRQPMTNVIEEVARALRRGAHNYVSFECALSEYGRISQIPVGTLTVATTGNPGRFQTKFGMIEFTRVKRSAIEIPDATVDMDRPLPFARVETALDDLRTANRNLHLLLDDEAPELEGTP